MTAYRFRYLQGQSMPFHPLEADSDADFHKKLVEWERKNGFRHVPGTVTCNTNGLTNKVPEPSFA